MAIKTIIARGGARTRRRPSFAPTAAVTLLLAASQVIPAPVQVATATITPDRVLSASQSVPAPAQTATVTVQPSLSASQNVRAPVQRAALSHPSLGGNQTILPPVQVATLENIDHLYVAQAIAAPLQRAFLHVPALPVQVATLTTSHEIHVAQALLAPLQRAAISTSSSPNHTTGTAFSTSNPIGVSGGPFYFCLADETETTFGPQFCQSQFEFVRATINHAEGQKPALSIDIKNTAATLGGLLAPGAQLWAWLSWRNLTSQTIVVDGVSYDPGNVIPLFYGHLVGIPTSMIGETVTLTYIADAVDWVEQRQLLAETLKARPFWDPVFSPSPAQDDDPDFILEARPQHYHYARIAGPASITVSNWHVGEDGTISFNPPPGFPDTPSPLTPYSSLQVRLLQPPLMAVRVEAHLEWNQTGQGVLDMGGNVISTFYSGIKEDWPKVGHSLGGGWSISSGVASDFSLADYATDNKYSTHFTNTQPTHQTGEMMTLNISATYPSVAGVLNTIYHRVQTGFQDPGTGTNIPFTADASYMYGPLARSISTSLGLRYRASRRRKEDFNFTMVADVQPILVATASDRLSTLETELITKKGVDVGIPLINVLDWSSVQGQAVTVGTVVFPNNPLVAGGQSLQICIGAGTAGSVEPTFSDTVGDETTDGTVTWASMGQSPQLQFPDWAAYTTIPVGFCILPLTPPVVDYNALIAQNLNQTIPTGTQVPYGIIVSGLGQCTLEGVIGGGGSSPAEFTPCGIPSGDFIYMCVQGGETGEVLPFFGSTIGGLTGDGGVIWKCIAALGDASTGTGFYIPVGGSGGNVAASMYFNSTRGNWSAEYLMCLARARLLWRARCIEAAFDCPWEQAITLSCRWNATMNDARIPGGTLTGKVTEYVLDIDGNKGLMIGHVKLGCTIGNGGTAAALPPVEIALPGGIYVPPGTTLEADGDGGYAAYPPGLPSIVVTVNPDFSYTMTVGGMTYNYPDYNSFIAAYQGILGTLGVLFFANYQAMIDYYTVPPGGEYQDSVFLPDGVEDLQYMPPIGSPNDDGITFPIGNKLQVVISESWNGSIQDELPYIQLEQNLRVNDAIAAANNINLTTFQAVNQARVLAAQIQYPQYYELILKPVAGNTFENSYNLTLTPLNVPKTIDLGAT